MAFFDKNITACIVGSDSLKKFQRTYCNINLINGQWTEVSLHQSKIKMTTGNYNATIYTYD